MTQVAIYSRDKQKSAHVTNTAEGIRIELRQAGNDIPYLDAYLHDMLTYSAGKPWKVQTGSLASAHVASDADSIHIEGALHSLFVQLRLSFDEHQLLQWQIIWENRSKQRLEDVAVGVLFALPRHSDDKVTIPHMIYNNNPSADPNKTVPKLGIGPGKGFICEEHRLPIPCVNVEWTDSSANRYLSLFSEPDYIESEDGVVHYGSLGAIQEDERLLFAAMSGVLMFNGENDVYYISKSLTAPYDKGYLPFAPGFALTKQYALDWGGGQKSGHAFREIVRKGLELYEPVGAQPLSIDEMIRLKSNALDDRWRVTEEGAAGYVKFGDSNSFGKVSKHPPHFMYGWTGQCLKLAWCDAKLGFEQGDPERIRRCELAADFYVRESATGVPGLRHGSYQLPDAKWDDYNRNREKVAASRAYGETLSDLAEIIMLFREQGRPVPEAWENALKEAADFILGSSLPSGIYPVAWNMEGDAADDMITAAGIPCVIAVLKAYKVTGDARYLAEAEAKMRRYYELHAETFDRPFARSTLDASCEDKEAGMYFFMAAYELYALTGKEEYNEMAEISADWLLTFVFLWNPAYNEGSMFREAGFSAVGWPGVSVQNHHLDVFFPTYEFWHYGRLSGKPKYERLGLMSFYAMGQGICREPGDWKFTVVGEQAEGFFQTQWQNHGNSNTWNPSWVIALVLHNGLRLKDAIN